MENNQTKKFFLYARKSTDEPERQILSIEAQLFELREYARKENLNITKEFIENKTAKEPGREIFNQILSEIEKGNAEGTPPSMSLELSNFRTELKRNLNLLKSNLNCLEGGGSHFLV